MDLHHKVLVRFAHFAPYHAFSVFAPESTYLARRLRLLPHDVTMTSVIRTEIRFRPSGVDDDFPTCKACVMQPKVRVNEVLLSCDVSPFSIASQDPMV
jgi:hypothetical protein